MICVYVFKCGTYRVYRQYIVARSLSEAEHIMRYAYGFQDGDFELERVGPAWNSDVVQDDKSPDDILKGE